MYSGYSGATYTGGALTSGVVLVNGTNTVIPLEFQTGTLLDSQTAGAIEYDGIDTYITNETTAGRGIIPVEQHFKLTEAGGNITSIANFFGSTSNIPLVSGGYYEIDIDLWFYVKTSASTVVWTLTNSAAPTAMNIYYSQTPVTGVATTPVATQLNAWIYNSTSAAQTITTGSLTTLVNHFVRIHILLENSTGTSLKIQATSTSGSITPGIGSMWKCKRIPAANVGTFAA